MSFEAVDTSLMDIHGVIAFKNKKIRKLNVKRFYINDKNIPWYIYLDNDSI